MWAIYIVHILMKIISSWHTARFEEAIIELDGERHPDCMFLMGSSLTSVIATIDGICRVVKTMCLLN
ncbi:MAG: hypothetical protein ACLSCV_10025 [Acutalibacteraceae bacterium]